MDSRLAALSIPFDATLRQALQAIDTGAAAVAFVVDDGRLVGVLTDGDARRALLAGATLDDAVGPFVSRSPYVVSPTHGRAEVLDLMRALSIAQVPIVDENDRLLGLHIMRDLIGATERSNCAVIMAGGRGTRLARLTETIPKPMITVAGRPILERLILHLVGSGIRRIFLAVNYKAMVIEDHFKGGEDFGCTIDYLRENPELPLGTAGALTLLAGADFEPTEPLLLMNGDLVTQFLVGNLLEYHEQSSSIATIVARPYAHEIPFGIVETDEHGRLIRIREKPVESWNANAGVYVLDPAMLHRIAPDTPMDMPDLLQTCITEGEKVAVWIMEGGDWVDVGRPADLKRARGEF